MSGLPQAESAIMARRPSPSVYRSKELETFLGTLPPSDTRVKWITDMELVLKENMFAGEQVKKSQIPVEYRKLKVNNLYRFSHPKGYRSCYTLVHYENIGVCPLVLDMMNHKEYDRVFGYRSR